MSNRRSPNFKPADRRVASRVVQGNGCSATCDGRGTSYYFYAANAVASEDRNAWHLRTIETLPGYKFTDLTNDQNTFIVTYANFAGQTMLQVHKQGNYNYPAAATTLSASFTQYDEQGNAILAGSGSAITGYDESYADLLHCVSGNYQYLADGAGLYHVSEYYASTTATTSVAGGVENYFYRSGVKNGETCQTIEWQSSTTYIVHEWTPTEWDDEDPQTEDPKITIYPVAAQTTYPNDGGSGALTTTYSYTWNATSGAMASQTVTRPAVSTGHNGSDSAVSETTVYDAAGRAVWMKDAEGFLSYSEYDAVTGALVKSIADVLVGGSGYSNLPSGWTTPAGGGLHLVTTYELDGLGRTIAVTGPDNVTSYTVYLDYERQDGDAWILNETRTYSAWDPVTNRPTGPTIIRREIVWNDPASTDVARYSESLSISAAPALTSGRPNGTESFAMADIQSLSRQYLNLGGQVIASDAYHSRQDLTYSTAIDIGALGVNRYRTTYSYNRRGWLKRTEGPDGTIQRNEFDNLGRTLSTWIGTDDVPTEGRWSPDNNTGANMLQVSESVYNFDSQLTQSTSFGSATAEYVTDYGYDWRGRTVATRGPDGTVTVRELDNLGRAYRTKTYADLDADYFTVGAEAAELRGQNEQDHDERGQVWRTRVYEVNPSTGQLGDRLTSLVWYNGRGMTIKTANGNGLFQKSQYDGAGRLVASFVSFDADETLYADADDVAGDTVIEQQKSIYNASGNVIVSLFFQRFDNDTTSTGELTAANSYATGSANWFDRGGRTTHSASYGHESGTTGTRYLFNTSGQIIDTNANGIPDVAEAAAPTQYSDDYILGKVQYDAAGRVYEQFDNLGQKTVTLYDLLGRTTAVIENYVNGTVSETEASDTDRTTEYHYDSAGRLWQQVALNPKGDDNDPYTSNVEGQVTMYLYESAISGSFVTSIIYPDSPDSTSSGSDQVKFTYDRLARKITSTDQRGVVHEYAFDSAGRLESDAVTSLGQSGIVDGAVRRIGYAYEDMGRPLTITSFDAATSGNVVNQIKFTYDGWGSVIKSEQAHDGAVGAGTPAVQYGYGDGAASGEAKYVRLESVTYPDGRVVEYGYSSTGVGGALNRLESIGDGSSDYAVYTFLGAGTIVKIEHPAVSGGLTLSYGTAANHYAGLDRFGQILEQKWTNGAGTTTLDHLTYTYDRNGNRASKTNQLASAFSEGYTYDGLNRLTDADRNSQNLQSWDLDSLGNWDGTTLGTIQQTREHNAANEVTSISGAWADPTYDAAGNMTSGPKAGDEATRLHYVYNAWNQLVKAYADNAGQPGTLIATYEYDGQGRRIEKNLNGGDSFDYYLNEQYQIIETRLNGDADPIDQWVFDVRYVDAPIVRFHDANTDGDYADPSDNIMLVMQDANFNVTGVVNASTGGAVERYVVAPYGGLTILAGDFSGRSLSSFAWITGHQGLAVDLETGLVYNRARYLDTSMGRFTVRDPLGYVDGMSVYQYVWSSPTSVSDPSGQSSWWLGYYSVNTDYDPYDRLSISELQAVLADLEARKDYDWNQPGRRDGAWLWEQVQQTKQKLRELGVGGLTGFKLWLEENPKARYSNPNGNGPIMIAAGARAPRPAGSKSFNLHVALSDKIWWIVQNAMMGKGSPAANNRAMDYPGPDGSVLNAPMKHNYSNRGNPKFAGPSGQNEGGGRLHPEPMRHAIGEMNHIGAKANGRNNAYIALAQSGAGATKEVLQGDFWFTVVVYYQDRCPYYYVEGNYSTMHGQTLVDSALGK